MSVRDSYFTVLGWMRTDLNLKGNDLLVYAVIYSFSRDGESEFHGSIGYLEEFTGAQKNTIFRSLSKLEAEGLIEKIDRHTVLGLPNWYKAVPLAKLNLPEGGIHQNGATPCTEIGQASHQNETTLYKVDNYNDILDYLNMYLENPKIELITKLTDSRFAVSKQIVALAAKDKGFIKWLKENYRQVKDRYFTIGAIIEAYKRKLDVKTVEKLRETRRQILNYARGYERYGRRDKDEKSLADTYKSWDKAKRDKVVQYIHRMNISPHHYNDYLRSCLNLDLDLNDTKNLFPKNFKYWSEVRINQFATLRAEREAAMRAKLEERIKSVAEKYSPLSWGNESYVAIIADSKQSLISEGKALHHCVGQMDYDQRMMKERSLIFFIRKKDTPETPLATVEFSIEKNGKVLQCYGEHDSKPEADILHFVNDLWQPQASRALKKIAEKQAA